MTKNNVRGFIELAPDKKHFKIIFDIDVFTPFVVQFPENTLLWRAGFKEMAGEEGDALRFESIELKVIEINQLGQWAIKVDSIDGYVGVI